MNTMQTKYAILRVAEITKIKLRSLGEALSAAKLPALKGSERAALIRSGKVKLRGDVDTISSYDNVVNVFDFSKFEGASVKTMEKHHAAVAEVNAKAERIKDEIVLGEEAVALRLIEEFSEA